MTAKLTKQKMINFYDLKEVKQMMPKTINPGFKGHGISLFFNSLMIGASGSGKTNCLLNLLNVFKNTFNHMYIFTKAEEPLYLFLQKKLGNLLTIKYGYDEFVKFDKSLFYGQSLVIFDDMNAEPKQDAIREHYIKGRKLSNTPGKGGCCSIYLAQSYFDIPNMVRNQCDLIFILKVPSIKNLDRIMAEYALGDTKEEIQKKYKYSCVDNEFGDFLLINVKAKPDKIYRKNYDEYLNNNNLKFKNYNDKKIKLNI